MPRRLRSARLHVLALLQAALPLWKWTSALPTIDCSPNHITPAALHCPPRSLRTSSPARCKSSLSDLSEASNTLPSCSINIQPCFQDNALWFSSHLWLFILFYPPSKFLFCRCSPASGPQPASLQTLHGDSLHSHLAVLHKPSIQTR